MLPDGALKQVTNYPELSWALAGIVLIAFAALVYRAVVSGTPKGQSKAGGEVNVYFDGPLAKALASLESIADSLKTLPALIPMLKEYHEAVGERMRRVYQRMDEERRESADDHDKQDAKLTELGERVARLEGQQRRAR